MFLNLISCPEGVRKLGKDFPNVLIVSAELDERLNEKSYILPGIGDMGDRYYFTV